MTVKAYTIQEAESLFHKKAKTLRRKLGMNKRRGLRRNPAMKVLGYRSGMQYLTDGKDVYRRDKMDMKHGGMRWYSTLAGFESFIRAYGPLIAPRGLRANPGESIDIKKIKTIDIYGKLWRDKTYGNTYFASRAIINFGMPSEMEIFYPLQYGYGNSYADIPLDDIMGRAGIEQRMRSAWRLRDAYGIILRQGAEYVKKAEAKAWGEAR